MLGYFLSTRIAMADIVHFLAGVLWILPFTLILHCDSRLLGFQQPLTTKSCPRNKTEWEKRSDALNCSKKNGYMCLPNDNFTELVEICYRYPRRSIKKGVCLYLNSKTLLVDEYKCHNFTDGCPNSTYYSYQAYNYQLCTSIRDGCFLAEESCIRRKSQTSNSSNNSTTTDRIETLEKSIHIVTGNRRCWVKMKPLTLNGTLLLTVTIFVWGFRHKIKIFLQKTKLGQKIKETISTRDACQDESTWTTLIIHYSLQVACELGQDIVVNWISTKYSSAMHYWDPHGTTPLHVACQYGHDGIVKMLLNSPAIGNQWDRYGTTPLHIACQYGHDGIVEILLKYLRQVFHEDKYQFDRYGTTPLHIACQYGHDDIVKILLKYLGPVLDEDKYQFDRYGTTPLHVACQNGHLGIVKCFLEHEDPSIYKGIINQCDRNGTTPLHVACQYGYDSIVELLKSKGAN